MNNLPFLLISLALFFVWALFLFFGRQTRREQIIMSLVGLVLTPAIVLMAINDYLSFNPFENGYLGVENFVFAFSLTGVAAVAYEILVGRRLKPLRRKHLWGEHHLNWLATMVIILGAWTGISSAMFFLFPVGSVYSFIVGGLLVFTYMIAERHDLLVDAIFSSLFMAILVFGLEQIFFRHIFSVSASASWQIDRLSGLAFNQIPIEEIVWVAVVGLAIGPVYEFVRQYQVKN